MTFHMHAAVDSDEITVLATQFEEFFNPIAICHLEAARGWLQKTSQAK